ncbi:MAG: DUF6505 family protein [Hyphomicrobiaceae bacterium]
MSSGRIKLLRTIRFDASDDAVYDLAAGADEWAVSGAFAFADLPDEALTGKTRQAFVNGFLGVPGLGRSTFVTVGEADEDAVSELVYRLALHFVDAYGAPDIAAAMPAADAEVAFARSLAEGQPINTVLTVLRRRGEDGEIREQFRTIRPPSAEPLHARIFSVEPDGT